MNLFASFSNGVSAMTDSLFIDPPSFKSGFLIDKRKLNSDFNKFNLDLKKGITAIEQKERIKNNPDKWKRSEQST